MGVRVRVVSSVEPFVPAGFKPFADHRIHTGLFGLFSVSRRGNGMKDPYAGFLEHLGIDVGSSHRDDGHGHRFFQDHLHDFLRIDQQFAESGDDIYGKRFGGERFYPADLFSHPFGSLTGIGGDVRGSGIGAQGPQAAGIGDGRGQFGAADPVHGRLDDGVTDAQQLADAILAHF